MRVEKLIKFAGLESSNIDEKIEKTYTIEDLYSFGRDFVDF